MHIPFHDLRDATVHVPQRGADDALSNAAQARDAYGDIALKRLLALATLHLLDCQCAVDFRLHIINHHDDLSPSTMYIHSWVAMLCIRYDTGHNMWHMKAVQWPCTAVCVRADLVLEDGRDAVHEQLEWRILQELGVIADDVCVCQLATRDVVLQPLWHEPVDVRLGHQLEHLQGPANWQGLQKAR